MAQSTRLFEGDRIGALRKLVRLNQSLAGSVIGPARGTTLVNFSENKMKAKKPAGVDAWFPLAQGG